MADIELPQWMDKADVGTIAVLTLDDGERLTVEVRDVDGEKDELIVDVIPTKGAHPNTQRGRAIPIGRVVSFEPRPRTEQPWPHSDPCRGTSFSGARFALLATLFLGWIIGGLTLALFLIWKPGALPAVSAIVYTSAVVWYTFARVGHRFRGKDLPPYMFTCPAVRQQFPRLILRHLWFLVALLALQSLALTVRSNLPAWWNTNSGGSTPFEVALVFLCCGLAITQVFTNRRLLARAHREFSS
jgi:hypothetical protein